MTGIVNDKARSPYQRYAKAPTLYSAEYQRWLQAVRKNDDSATREAHRAWMLRHGPDREIAKRFSKAA